MSRLIDSPFCVLKDRSFPREPAHAASSARSEILSLAGKNDRLLFRMATTGRAARRGGSVTAVALLADVVNNSDV